MRAWMMLLCMIVATPAFAASPAQDEDGQAFFQDKERGWFWYEEPPAPEAKKDIEKPLASYPFPPPTIDEAQRQLKDLKERAVMHPSEENLVAYIRLQNWVNDKSEQFAGMWQRVIWRHPGLDYSIGHPTDARAILVRKDADIANYSARLAAIGRTYGLFFIFRSTCPYCHREAPMLKRFARRYGISVIPISQDGPGLPDYPHPRPDAGISVQMGVQSVPALFLVNPNRREVIPIAYGLISEQELIQRMTSLTEHIEQPLNTGYPGDRR